MKKCPVCGVEHADNVPVCSICGTPLTSGAVAEKPASPPQPEPAASAPDFAAEDIRAAVSSVVSQVVDHAEESKQEKPSAAPQPEPAAEAPAEAKPEDDEPFDDDSPFVVNAMRPTAEQRARKEASAAQPAGASETSGSSKEPRKPAARPRGGKKPSAGPSKGTAHKPAQEQPSAASGSSRTEGAKSSTGRFATGKTAAPRNTGRPAASRHQPPAAPVVDTSAVAAASAQKVQEAKQNAMAAKARSAQKGSVSTDTGEFDWSERKHKRRQPKTTTPVIAAVCALLALLIIAMIVLIGRMIAGDGNPNADGGTPNSGVSDGVEDETTDGQDTTDPNAADDSTAGETDDTTDGTEDMNTPTDETDTPETPDDTAGDTADGETGTETDETAPSDTAETGGDGTETGDGSTDTADGGSTGDTSSERPALPSITEVNDTVYATASLRVRDYPSAEYGEVINSLSAGQAVTRTGRCSNGWSRVEIGGVTGYVSENYLSTTQPADSSTGDTTLDGITITAVDETVYATTGVNVRNYPSSTGTVINTLSQGQSVTRTGRCSNGWSRVEIGGVTGYVYSDYLSTSQSGGSDSGSGSLDGITITEVNETVYATTGVNVRDYPGSSGTVINTLSQGQSVTRTGRCSNGWSRVRVGGVTGYVYSSYLSTSQSGGGSGSGGGASSSSYILPDSDSRYYSRSELSSLSASELRLARNEIYARNGRRFNDSSLQEYFNDKTWYSGTVDAATFDANINSYLNDYELANLLLIIDLENG
ncbi:MAG TPA: SH3 domain-containing protein [Candidatus Onthomonas avicola]|nr:SH3 domain-containing protein [Candidatus Onthomonas avicola]